jgi:hypothetical protein
MAQATTLTVNDRQSPTPVAHTFVPQRVETEMATFSEAGAVPLGDKLFSISRRTTANGFVKCRVRLVVPVVSTDSSTGTPISTLTRTSYADMTLTFAPDSTSAERADVVGMFQNVLAASQTMVDKTIVGLENIF